MTRKLEKLETAKIRKTKKKIENSFPLRRHFLITTIKGATRQTKIAIGSYAPYLPLNPSDPTLPVPLNLSQSFMDPSEGQFQQSPISVSLYGVFQNLWGVRY